MMEEKAPKCCVKSMELKAVNQTGTSVSRFGTKKIFSHHFQCKYCGKIKTKEVRI